MHQSVTHIIWYIQLYLYSHILVYVPYALYMYEWHTCAVLMQHVQSYVYSAEIQLDSAVWCNSIHTADLVYIKLQLILIYIHSFRYLHGAVSNTPGGL